MNSRRILEQRSQGLQHHRSAFDKILVPLRLRGQLHLDLSRERPYRVQYHLVACPLISCGFEPHQIARVEGIEPQCTDQLSLPERAQVPTQAHRVVR